MVMICFGEGVIRGRVLIPILLVGKFYFWNGLVINGVEFDELVFFWGEG